jgi:hypothetical protein
MAAALTAALSQRERETCVGDGRKALSLWERVR